MGRPDRRTLGAGGFHRPPFLWLARRCRPAMMHGMTFCPTHRLPLPLMGAGVALWLAAAGTSAGAFPFFEPVRPPRAVQVMAHGGAGRQAPANTRPALEHCIEDQLEWAEVDVRRTRDGRHVLARFATVTNATGVSFQIHETDWAILSQVDVGTAFAERFRGTTLLSLEEGFALCRGRLNLYLDCKAVDAGQLVQEILDARMAGQVVVKLDAEGSRQVRQLGGGKIALLTPWQPGLEGADWVATQGLAAVAMDAPEVTPARVADFHRVGIRVLAKVLGDWDQPGFWERAMAAGADWLLTEVPEEVLAQALWRRVPRRPVLISLHRGASRYAPENTLPAFEKAVRLGVDYVEFDVRATRDGRCFLLHDAHLDRTTDGRGPIREATAAAVRRLDAGVKFSRAFAQTPVPGLEQFLSAFSGRVQFYFDAKQMRPDRLVKALDAHQMIERTVVYQMPPFLAELKAMAPAIRCLPPLRSAAQLDEIARLKPYAVDADWKILSPDLVSRCHAHGIKVFADALGEHEQVEAYLQAMDWGLDLIQTDHPLRVMRAIELWSERHTPR